MPTHTSPNLHRFGEITFAVFFAVLTLSISSPRPALAQTVSTWSGGAGNWSDCPPSGNALWDTCPDPPNGLGWPNGNFNAVINGGPVTATSASIVNLTIGSGGSLVFQSGQPGILDITGTSMVNNGSITLAGSDGLQIQGNTTVTLSGSGSVTLAGNSFAGSNGSPTLILQQPVQGQGSFSLGLTLNNQSTVNATGGTLTMQPNALTNTGTMQASSGAILAFTNGVPTAFTNTGGKIQALDGGTVQLDNGVYTGGTLTTAGTGVIQLNFAGVLNGLTNAGTLQVSTGTLQNTITNTGVIHVPSATLAMTGPVTLKGSGSLLMSGTANLKQLSSSTDTLTSSQLIHGAGTIFQLPLTNTSTATVSADSSGNKLALFGSSTTNTGILQATGGGILELDSVINNTGGKIQALSGSTVILTSNSSINGGLLTTSGTGTIQSQNGVLDGTVNVPTNAGKLNVKSFDLFFQGTINNTGTIALTGNSCVILNQPSLLEGTGKLTMASTTCIFGAGLSFTNASNIQGAGSIGDSNPMPITNTGTILANSSSPLIIHPDGSGFTNTGKLTVNPGSTLNILAPFNTLSAGALSAGTYMVSGILDFPAAVVTNNASVTLTGAAAEIFNTAGGTNALATLAANSSKGVLSLQKGQVLSATTGAFSNAGKLTVGIGSGFGVGGSYTQTAGTTTVDGSMTASGGLTLQKGTLLGQGTIASAVTSNAVVTVGDATTKAGKLSMSAYTQNSTGSLNVGIGGLTAGTQYSQLAVGNGASLNGTLNVKLINGFVPAIGNTFTILTASTVNGTFATVKGLSINSSEHFTIAYNPTNVMLTVVAGP